MKGRELELMLALTREMQAHNVTRAREDALFKLYNNLRRSLESYGPVDPLKQILKRHLRDVELYGYTDPLQNPRNLLIAADEGC